MESSGQFARIDLPHEELGHQLAVHRHLTDRAPKNYYGKAAKDLVKAGNYSQGTESAHPLHYVDTNGDGTGWIQSG